MRRTSLSVSVNDGPPVRFPGCAPNGPLEEPPPRPFGCPARLRRQGTKCTLKAETRPSNRHGFGLATLGRAVARLRHGHAPQTVLERDRGRRAVAQHARELAESVSDRWGSRRHVEWLALLAGEAQCEAAHVVCDDLTMLAGDLDTPGAGAGGP